MPLPSFGKSYPLGDDPVPDFAGATKQLVMQRYVGARPNRIFVQEGAIGITLHEILLDVQLALFVFDVSDDRGSIRNKGDLRGGGEPSKPFRRRDRHSRFDVPTCDTVREVVPSLLS